MRVYYVRNTATKNVLVVRHDDGWRWVGGNQTKRGYATTWPTKTAAQVAATLTGCPTAAIQWATLDENTESTPTTRVPLKVVDGGKYQVSNCGQKVHRNDNGFDERNVPCGVKEMPRV